MYVLSDQGLTGVRDVWTGEQCRWLFEPGILIQGHQNFILVNLYHVWMYVLSGFSIVSQLFEKDGDCIVMLVYVGFSLLGACVLYDELLTLDLPGTQRKQDCGQATYVGYRNSIDRVYDTTGMIGDFEDVELIHG